MEKKCEHIQALLIDYHDKVLPTEQEEIVREHLLTCPYCKAEIEQLSGIFNDLQDLPVEEPSDLVRDNFYAMLNREVEKKSTEASISRINSTVTFPRMAFRIAAAVALLITGLAAGLLFPRGESIDKKEVRTLRSEVDELQKNVILARLDQQSPSQRILAASSVQESGTADESVIDALITTMETDENINVRMSAMHALYRFRENQRVRESLVDALGTQTDPVLQITLINMMVEMQEEEAVKHIKRIIEEEETLPTVKEMAEKGLKNIRA